MYIEFQLHLSLVYRRRRHCSRSTCKKDTYLMSGIQEPVTDKRATPQNNLPYLKQRPVGLQSTTKEES